MTPPAESIGALPLRSSQADDALQYPLTPAEQLPSEEGDLFSADFLMPPVSPNTWLQSFSKWPDRMQATALEKLVGILHHSRGGAQHLMLLENQMRPLLQRDFIALLPEETSLLILSHLDQASLCICAQVSRAWRHISARDALWRVHCNRQQLTTSILPAMQRRLGRPQSSWKEVYMTKLKVERAWVTQPLPSLTQLDAHRGHVITCLVMSDSGLIISGSDDCTLRVWDSWELETRRDPLHVLLGHQGGVWCCAVNGRTMVSGSTDRNLRVWDLSSGRCLQTLSGHSSTVRCVCLGVRFIVSGSRDATVRVWSSTSGESLHVLRGHTDPVRWLVCLQYCPCPNY